MSIVKQPSEALPLSINFDPWLVDGETVDSTIILVDGVDVGSQGSIINSWEVQNGNTIAMVATGGTSGTDYLVTARIYTSLANTYEYDITINVRENSSEIYVNPDLTYFLTYDSASSTLYVMPSISGSFGKNYEYTVTIKAGLSGYIDTDQIATSAMSEDYVFNFTSQYCPLFTTLTKVKLQAGPEIDVFSDDTIYKMINKNSIDTVDLYNLEHPTAPISYDYFGCTWNNVPIQLRRYVECKTAYDLLAIIKSVNAGGELKTLGDMTIKYTPQNTSNKPDPNKMKELYDCWRESMRSLSNVGVAVKAIYDTSLGFGHPAMSPSQNRVIRPISFRMGYMTPGSPYRRGI